MTNYEFAFEIARRAHAAQKDKAGKAYIEHPITVASLVHSDEAKIAAILHDVAEDSDITVESLRVLFGDEIGDALESLTHRKGENYEDYVKRVSKNEIATEVKIADLTHNLDLGRLPFVTEADIVRAEKYKKALRFLNSIA